MKNKMKWIYTTEKVRVRVRVRIRFGFRVTRLTYNTEKVSHEG